MKIGLSEFVGSVFVAGYVCILWVGWATGLSVFSRRKILHDHITGLSAAVTGLPATGHSLLASDTRSYSLFTLTNLVLH